MIEKKLISILEKNSRNKVDLQAYPINLIDDLGMDSITLIKVVIDIEREFDIEIDDDQLDFRSLADFSNLLRYIILKLENSSGER